MWWEGVQRQHFLTMTAQKVLPTQDLLHPAPPPPNLPEAFGGRGSSIPMSTIRVSNSQPGVCRQNPTIVMSNEFRQSYSPADEFAATDHGKDKVQHRPSLSSQPSYQSCIHLEVPLRSNSSFVFLDKPLCISLVELKGRRAGQPTLHRSTFFIYLGVSSCHRPSTDKKPADANKGYRKPRAAMLVSNSDSDRGNGLGQCRSPLPKHQGSKAELRGPTCGLNCVADYSGTNILIDTLGLLSFRGPCLANTKAGKQKGNADEVALLTQNNFRHWRRNSNIGPVVSRTSSKQGWCEKAEEQQNRDCTTDPQKIFALDKTCSSSKTLSLKEALELLRPGFIRRSQGRVRRLEQRAMKRRELRDSPDLVEDLRDQRREHKMNCTTPDPLCDNLFRPRERSISGKEMQLRSRRIYNRLPEVTRKREEERKMAVSKTNRLRGEVFKKRLLDQILQR